MRTRSPKGIELGIIGEYSARPDNRIHHRIVVVSGNIIYIYHHQRAQINLCVTRISVTRIAVHINII